MSDSFDSFDDFFSSGKSDTSKMANLEVILSQLFNFSEKMFTQLATIIDQLDAKVTGFESQIKSLENRVQNAARAPPPSAASSSPGFAPPMPSASSPGLPPPPAGVGGLPPLPGLTPPPSSGGGPPGPGGSGGPDSGNPLMVRAQLQNELAEAFKKIRANLKEDE